MTKESFGYRSRKWLCQQASRFVPSGGQQKHLKSMEWDVLIVLDACRYDVFDNVADWPVRRARSPASKTSEWLEAAEESGLFENTTIVAGNANYTYDRWDLRAREIKNVFQDHWDSKLGIVPPEPVLESVDESLDDGGGGKPVVGHVLPPHGPYIARVDDLWLPVFPDVNVWKRGPEFAEEGISPQVAMATGVIDPDEAWDAYRASVKSVWQVCRPYIADWVRDGHRVVVTSDHGEVFGRLSEAGLYAHPYRCYLPALVDVPIATFAPGREPRREPETPDEHLAALGYKEAPGD